MILGALINRLAPFGLSVNAWEKNVVTESLVSLNLCLNYYYVYHNKLHFHLHFISFLCCERNQIKSVAHCILQRDFVCFHFSFILCDFVA